MINRESFGRVFRVSKKVQEQHDKLVAKKKKIDKAYDEADCKLRLFIRKNTPSGAKYYAANLITDEHYVECRDIGVY